MLQIEKENFIKICNESSTMRKASIQLGIHFNTFKKYALLFGCYNPNQSGLGIKKNSNADRLIPLSEILEGKHPQYQTYKLKHRLFKEKIKENTCEQCGISDWNNKNLECELDHVDGNSSNHILSNLKILCPNCHSQTSTFRSKNKRRCSPTGRGN